MQFHKDPALVATDIHVGAAIKKRRLALKMSREKLAANARLGTSEQIRKFETGDTTVKASQLFCIANALDCDPWNFFDGLPGQGGSNVVALPEFATKPNIELSRAVSTMPKSQQGKVLRIIQPDHSTDRGCITTNHTNGEY